MFKKWFSKNGKNGHKKEEKYPPGLKQKLDAIQYKNDTAQRILNMFERRKENTPITFDRRKALPS